MSEISKYEAQKKKLDGLCEEHEHKEPHRVFHNK